MNGSARPIARTYRRTALARVGDFCLVLAIGLLLLALACNSLITAKSNASARDVVKKHSTPV